MSDQQDNSDAVKASTPDTRWVRWRDGYDSVSALRSRLNLVNTQISKCLDHASPGRIRIISVCAGDGRDIVGVLSMHRRSHDVTGWLVESDAHMAEAGRRAIKKEVLGDRLSYLIEDATLSSTYLKIAPADVVVIAGVFGNLQGTEALKLIEHLPSICNEGAFVVWTRHCSINDGRTQLVLLSEWFARNEFELFNCEFTPGKEFIVATHRYVGSCRALIGGQKWFHFDS